MIKHGLLFLFLSTVVDAFTAGAGACFEGMAAVASTHLTAATVTTGTLTEGAITVEIDGMPVDSVTLTPGQDYTVTVTGNPSYRGFLVRVASGTLSVEDSSTTQISSRCTAEGVSGITHVNSNPKSTVSSVLSIPMAGSVRMDITIVIQNSGGLSEYYYSGYDLAVQAPPPPTTMPSSSPSLEPSVSIAPSVPATPAPTPMPTPTPAPTTSAPSPAPTESSATTKHLITPLALLLATFLL